MKRAFGRLKLELMGAGLDTMSQLAGAMEIAAGRGGAPHQKARILREGVGSLRFQVEQEQRKVIREDQASAGAGGGSDPGQAQGRRAPIRRANPASDGGPVSPKVRP
jgi:hypothetical protein